MVKSKIDKGVLYMICPECGKNTEVMRSLTRPNFRWRRRLCKTCQHKFTTYEIENIGDFPDRDDGWRSREMKYYFSKQDTSSFPIIDQRNESTEGGG